MLKSFECKRSLLVDVDSTCNCDPRLFGDARVKFVFEPSGGDHRIVFRTVVEVDDDPIASDLDVVEREWQLDTLKSQLFMLRTGFPGRRYARVSLSAELKKHQRNVRRLNQAIAMLEAQLAVWKVQNA
jgi:hypothetical protein